jgi:hypothetical protein
MVDQRIKEGCYVKNPDALKKAWNQTIGGLIKWAAGYTGGQCGEFAKWGREWSEQFVEKIFGKGAIVDTIWVGERSSRDIQTFEDWVDARYEANHAATRVILPTGESYVLDYWEAIKNKQSDPNAEVKLIPEGEWIEKWTKAIGETGDPAEVHNMNRSQRDLQSYIRACDTDEEAFEAFRKGKWSADAPLEATTPPQYVQTIINSWRKGGHRWEQINLDQE